MILVGIFAAVWVYLLTVLTRAKLTFFKFLAGSVGMFLLLMLTVRPMLTTRLAQAVAACAGLFGDISSMFESYARYSILFIQHGGEAISLIVDYECSGVIEILAFLSLLWFFPLYGATEKAILTIGGVAWIFVSNVLRLTLICIIVYVFGNNAFFFAHAVFGRIFFYALTIILYFNVFTRPQVMRQKVGKFTYGTDSL
ncbi:MAG: exosortase family protein XrtG [Oscillospiraceae bacterium]